mgnify:CR=1 FL=1|tara:strand:- start:362 stop:589 length:228 start_codon:yes stop_codon:yes gene_type:complete
MSNYIPVEGNADLVRDPKTDQIINTNTSGYEQYIARRKQRKLEKEKSSNIEEDLANLKSEMNEIKSLLRELVNGN